MYLAVCSVSISILKCHLQMFPKVVIFNCWAGFKQRGTCTADSRLSGSRQTSHRSNKYPKQRTSSRIAQHSYITGKKEV